MRPARCYTVLFGAGLPRGLVCRRHDPGATLTSLFPATRLAATPGCGASAATGWARTSVPPVGPRAGTLVTRAPAAETGRLAGTGPAGWVRAGWRGRLGSAGPGSTPTAARDRIRAGEDPLGDAFCALRSPAGRRVARADVHPAAGHREHDRLGGGDRDPPGAGRGPRLRLGPDAAGRRTPLAGGGPGRRGDRPGGRDHRPGQPGRGRVRGPVRGAARATTAAARLPPAGPTLFLGNPPYVRHHQIAAPGRTGSAAPPRERGCPPAGWPGCTPISSWPRPATRPRGPGRAHHRGRVAGRELRPPGPGAAARGARRSGGPPGRAGRAGVRGRRGDLGHRLLPPGPRWSADRCGGPDGPGGQPGRARCAGGRHPGAGPVLRDASRWGPLLRGAVASLPTAGRQARRSHGRTRRPASQAAGRPADHGGPDPPGLAGTPGPGPAGPTRAGGRASRSLPAGHVELGELCRVHRGQVTGANAVWVSAGPHPLVPARFRSPR